MHSHCVSLGHLGGSHQDMLIDKQDLLQEMLYEG